MNIQYDDREAGHLLGVWFVAIGALAVSTTRQSYTPVVADGVDTGLFCGLCVLIVVGAAVSRYRDAALGVPLAVGGGLVVWSVGRQLATAPPTFRLETLVLAVGLCSLGGLFVREGALIVCGRRHLGVDSPPQPRWWWWLSSLALIALGISL